MAGNVLFVTLLSLFAPLTLRAFYDTIEPYPPNIDDSIAGKLSGAPTMAGAVIPYDHGQGHVPRNPSASVKVPFESNVTSA